MGPWHPFRRDRDAVASAADRLVCSGQLYSLSRVNPPGGSRHVVWDYRRLRRSQNAKPPTKLFRTHLNIIPTSFHHTSVTVLFFAQMASVMGDKLKRQGIDVFMPNLVFSSFMKHVVASSCI